MDKIQLVLATKNKGKIKEFSELFGHTSIEALGLDQFAPIDDIAETGKTFVDNAVLKAVTTAKLLGVPAIADDSGLIVRALNNAPGIFSARYAGPHATDQQNIDKLLAKLGSNPNRRAAFKCFIAVGKPNGTSITFGGSCEGAIGFESRGHNGFGYDPVFLCGPLLNISFAELTPREKNLISHRAKALGNMLRHMDEVTSFLKA